MYYLSSHKSKVNGNCFLSTNKHPQEQERKLYFVYILALLCLIFPFYQQTPTGAGKEIVFCIHTCTPLPHLSFLPTNTHRSRKVFCIHTCTPLPHLSFLPTNTHRSRKGNCILYTYLHSSASSFLSTNKHPQEQERKLYFVYILALLCLIFPFYQQTPTGAGKEIVFCIHTCTPLPHLLYTCTCTPLPFPSVLQEATCTPCIIIQGLWRGC